MCHEIFTPIFSWFKSIWAPEKQPKVFSNLVSILLRYLINQSLWCASHCRVKGWTFRKIYADASHHGDKCSKFEKISEVCIPPLSQSPWCASYCGDDRHGVHHTAETNCTPRRQNWNLHLSLVAFKGTIRRNPLGGECIYHERKNFKHKMLIF